MKTGSFRHCARQPGAVSIARWAPRWARGLPAYPALAPTGRMLRMPLAPYRELYFETILAPLDPQTVWDDLHRLAGNAEPILLCWEGLQRPGEWCHRRMVAEWFADTLGRDVAEMSPDPDPQLALDL